MKQLAAIPALYATENVATEDKIMSLGNLAWKISPQDLLYA